MKSKKNQNGIKKANELVFEIKNYDVRLGHSSNAIWGSVKIRYQGMICCKGGNGERLHLYFLSPDSPNPSAKSHLDKKTGAIFLNSSEMTPYLDVLRNESNVYAGIHFDQPEWNCIGTSKEALHDIEDHYERPAHLLV